MKKLSNLLKGNPFIKDKFEFDIDIADISASSSFCKPGFLFVAIKGALPTSKDGHDFIEEAIKNGARAIIFDSHLALAKNYPVPMIKSSDSRAALAYLCEEFYGWPSSKLNIIGITGTNGKTSTSFMLHSILKEAGFKPKVMGTLGMGDPGNLEALSHTTMDPLFLSSALARMREEGVTHVIMEVSSHALSLKRVEALKFKAVALTNITQDHLDFHGTLEAYTEAKARLFFELADENTAIIWPNDHPFKSLPEFLEPMLVGSPKSDDPLEKTFILQQEKGSLFITLPFGGEIHIKNASLAATIAQALGISHEKIISGLNKTPPIPGRLQWIESVHDFKVVVDFAHTPDALFNILNTLKKRVKGRLILVFGCGGNRDQKKRPIMGKIAEQLASYIIVTDDNPRDEDPKSIRKSILSGMSSQAKVKEIGDRLQAIRTAIKMAQKNDMVVIAGKGHENYQITERAKTAFSDEQEAKKVLGEL